MNINVKVKLISKNYPSLCFRHAVVKALDGEEIVLDIDDYDSEYYLGSTYCVLCGQEQEDKELQHAKEISKTLKIGEQQK